MPGAWTSYTPTWTAASVNPTLANHTREGFYTQIGTTVHFTIRITFGSSGYGTGAYSFGLPITAANGSVYHAVYGRANDAGVAGYAVAGVINTTTAFVLHTGAGAGVGPTVPFTWGANDILTASGTYEAAQ